MMEGLLFSFCQHGALQSVASAMLPGVRLFAFLDDLHVLCAPERVSFLHRRLTVLWHFRIRIHAGNDSIVELSRGGASRVPASHR